jgi:Helix-turn-helix domain
MSPYEDPIPALKQLACAHLTDVMRCGNSDDVAGLLGTDRFRIADLKRGRLGRFSLETLLRFLTRAGLRVELRVERAPRPQRSPRDQPHH